MTDNGCPICRAPVPNFLMPRAKAKAKSKNRREEDKKRKKKAKGSGENDSDDSEEEDDKDKWGGAMKTRSYKRINQVVRCSDDFKMSV